MKVRFIEYDKELLMVVGLTYDTEFDPPECYVAVPLQEIVVNSVLYQLYTKNVPIEWATEITDKERIKTLVVLYGR